MLGPSTPCIPFDDMVILVSVMRLHVRLFGVNTRVKSNNGAEVQMCLLTLLLIWGSRVRRKLKKSHSKSLSKIRENKSVYRQVHRWHGNESGYCAAFKWRWYYNSDSNTCRIEQREEVSLAMINDFGNLIVQHLRVTWSFCHLYDRLTIHLRLYVLFVVTTHVNSAYWKLVNLFVTQYFIWIIDIFNQCHCCGTHRNHVRSPFRL